MQWTYHHHGVGTSTSKYYKEMAWIYLYLIVRHTIALVVL